MRLSKKILITIFAISLLAGCATSQQEREQEFREFLAKEKVFSEEKIHINIPEQNPISMRDVRWVIITKENYDAIFEQMQREGKDLVLFGLSDNDYENLSINMLELQNYIIINSKILEEYKKFYENSNKK